MFFRYEYQIYTLVVCIYYIYEVLSYYPAPLIKSSGSATIYSTHACGMSDILHFYSVHHGNVHRSEYRILYSTHARGMSAIVLVVVMFVLNYKMF